MVEEPTVKHQCASKFFRDNTFRSRHQLGNACGSCDEAAAAGDLPALRRFRRVGSMSPSLNTSVA
jgi:hypothetical protein